MPNVGIGELGLVLLVLLIAVGPKRMPEIARAAGKAWRTFQQETGKAREVFKDALDEPTREIRDAIEGPRREARAFIDETRKDARSLAAEARSIAEEGRSLAGVVDRPDGAPPRDPRKGIVEVQGPSETEPTLSNSDRLYEDT